MRNLRLDLDSVRHQISTVLAFLEHERHDGEAARHARLAAREIGRIVKMDDLAVKRRMWHLWPQEEPKC